MRLTQVLRRLIQLPVFTSVAVLTLAIGIGANAAIFSVIEGVLRKPLPFTRADELITVDHSAPGVSMKSIGAAAFLYFTYRDQARTLQDVAMVTSDTVSVTGVAEPEEVRSLHATQGLLPLLGVQPFIGRAFTPGDDEPRSPRTVILGIAAHARDRHPRRAVDALRAE